MISSSAWPNASSAVNPNIRSAARFQSRIFPSVPAAMIASPAAWTRDGKSSVSCREDLCRHAAHKPHNRCMTIGWYLCRVPHRPRGTSTPAASREQWPPPAAGVTQEAVGLQHFVGRQFLVTTPRQHRTPGHAEHTRHGDTAASRWLAGLGVFQRCRDGVPYGGL